MKKEVESVVSLIRRYVYGLDYYDEEWNQRILNHNDFTTNDVIALTAAYYNFLVKSKKPEQVADFDVYPYLLAFAYALEQELMDKIPINQTIEELLGGEASEDLNFLLEVKPYSHYTDIALCKYNASKSESVYSGTFKLLYILLIVLAVLGFVLYFKSK